MSTNDPWAQATQSSPSARAKRHVPRSSFNFAASVWNAKQRQLRVSLALSALAGVLFISLVWSGFSAGKTASTSRGEITALTNEQARLDAELKKITGGVTDLPGLVAQQQNAVDYVFSRDIAADAVLRILDTARVEGVVIKSVKVKNRLVDPPTGEDGYTAIYSVEVNATGVSLDVPARWQEALLGLDGTVLERPEVAYSVVSGNGVTMALTAGLKDEAVLLNRARTRELVGTPSATTVPAAPTTTVPQ
jgi:hypothetical protein